MVDFPEDPYSRFLAEEPSLGAETLRLSDEGRRLLEERKLRQAEKKLKEALKICPFAVPARNNLSLVYYLRKDYDRAVEEAKKTLKYYPEHTFAHCTLAMCFFNLGEKDRAKAHLDKAIHIYSTGTAPGEHLNKIVEALGVLGNDQRIYQLYSTEEEHKFGPLSLFRIGVALANLGKSDEAAQVWEESLHLDPSLRFLEVYKRVAKLQAQGKVPFFRFDYDTARGGEEFEVEDPPPGSKAFCADLLWNGSGEQQKMAVGFLVSYEDPWADQLLLNILKEKKLPDDIKLRAGAALVEKGLIGEDETMEIHLNGKLREVSLKLVSLRLPEEAIELYDKGIEYKEKGELDRAREAYERAIELAPFFASAMMNLANIYRSTSRIDEAEDLLRRAISIEPSSSAFLNLAGLYAQKGEFRRALTTLKRVSVEDLPPDAHPKYYYLLGRTYLDEDKLKKAERAFKNGLRIAPSHEFLKEGLALVSLKAMRGKLLKRFRELEERRRERQLSRPLSPSTPLEDALGSLTKSNLIGVARAFRLETAYLKKGELVELVAGYLTSNLRGVCAKLSPSEKEVLRWVIKEGGMVSYRKLTARFGDEKGDDLNWDYRPPESLLGRLRLFGLLFVGKMEMEGQPQRMALIPQELLRRLDPAGF